MNDTLPVPIEKKLTALEKRHKRHQRLLESHEDEKHERRNHHQRGYHKMRFTLPSLK